MQTDVYCLHFFGPDKIIQFPCNLILNCKMNIKNEISINSLNKFMISLISILLPNGLFLVLKGKLILLFINFPLKLSSYSNLFSQKPIKMTSLSDYHKQKYEKVKKSLVNAANEHLFNSNAMAGLYEQSSIMKTLLDKDRNVCKALLENLSYANDGNNSDSSSSMMWSTSPSKTESYSITSVSSSKHSGSVRSIRSALSRSSTSSCESENVLKFGQSNVDNTKM